MEGTLRSGIPGKWWMSGIYAILLPMQRYSPRVLERPDGLYFTHNYSLDNEIAEDSDMYGVKDYAADTAWTGEKPIAVICVDNLMSDRSIGEEELEALRLFAGYAGLAIENARLNQALQNESFCNAWFRRAFWIASPAYPANSRRASSSSSPIERSDIKLSTQITAMGFSPVQAATAA